MILPDNEETRARAAALVTAGGVIGFRTDTFYGLGADPLRSSAVKRIKELKGREDNKPILLLIADLADLDRLIVSTGEAFELLSNRFWPGPLTIVAEAANAIPDEITAGSGTVGVRLPDEKDLRALVRQCGGALTATSANRSGAEPCRSAGDVATSFPAGLDLIIDGGQVTVTKPSTVVDVTGMPVRIIREGEISRSAIETCLGQSFFDE